VNITMVGGGGVSGKKLDGIELGGVIHELARDAEKSERRWVRQERENRPRGEVRERERGKSKQEV